MKKMINTLAKDKFYLKELIKIISNKFQPKLKIRI